MEKAPQVIPVRPPTPTKDPHPDVHPHLPQISGAGGGACLLMISPVKTVEFDPDMDLNPTEH